MTHADRKHARRYSTRRVAILRDAVYFGRMYGKLSDPLWSIVDSLAPYRALPTLRNEARRDALRRVWIKNNSRPGVDIASE